jgi:CheY-like chemotaxis protein
MPRILIADDENDVVELLSIAFQGEGYETVSASSLPEAEAAIRAGGVDLAVIDMGMEGASTGAPAEKLKAAVRPAPKVLILTGRDLRRERERGHLAGADAALEKTSHPDLILQTVQRILSA